MRLSQENDSFKNSFPSRHPVFPAPFADNAVFSSICDFGLFVKNQMPDIRHIHIWVFYSLS